MRGWRWDWIGPVGIALLAFALRLWRLDRPGTLAFDETYYAKDAWSLLEFGYAQDFVEDADERIADGRLDGLFTGVPSQVTHPEAGKWFIALGEWMFGLDPVGWRIASVLAGSLTVLVLARMVVRLTQATWLSCLAGLLLAVDGAHFVLSRLALLDVFVTLWMVCAVACLVADRQWLEHRIERYRPVRPWQLAAGVCLGLATATKWSGLYVLAVFGLAIVVWEVLARRRAQRRRAPWVRTLLVVGAPAFVSLVGVALIVYIATWAGWLVHADVYEQRFGDGYGDYAPWGAYVTSPSAGWWGASWDALRSLWHYHVMTFDYHTGSYLADKTHPYESRPWGWLILDRPVAVDAQNDLPASTCGAPADSDCMRVVTILGNPAVWWTGVLSVVGSVVAMLARGGWRSSVPVLGIVATWVPWLFTGDRPIFSFYAVTSLPFLIVATCLLLDAARRRVRTPRTRYLLGYVAATILVAALTLFGYFFPILTDALVPYETWYSRMWFSRWI